MNEYFIMTVIIDGKYRWSENMRTMIRFTIPVEPGNRAFQSGTMQKMITELIERLKPEAAYFLPEQGIRTGMLFVDLKDPSDIPMIAEPLFEAFHARVEFLPAMNVDDLKRGLGRIR
jgi:hypothetical protein